MTDDDEAADAHGELMTATYRALCTHGYADLTMQDIADEASKSKSLLHYHYGTKEELLVAFLEYLTDEFDDALADEGGSARERLLSLVDVLLADEAEMKRLHQVLSELRTQATYNDAFREQLRRNKEYITGHLADIVAEGVESGEFREVDPERTARFVLCALDGARASAVSLDDDREVEAVRAGIREFVLDDLTRE